MKLENPLPLWCFRFSAKIWRIVICKFIIDRAAICHTLKYSYIKKFNQNLSLSLSLSLHSVFPFLHLFRHDLSFFLKKYNSKPENPNVFTFDLAGETRFQKNNFVSFPLSSFSFRDIILRTSIISLEKRKQGTRRGKTIIRDLWMYLYFLRASPKHVQIYYNE